MTLEMPEPSQPMDKETIHQFLLDNGWTHDKDGNARKQGDKRLFRVKFQDESLRIEVRVVREALPMRTKSGEWIRIGGGFYRNVRLLADGRMQIGSDFFGK